MFVSRPIEPPILVAKKKAEEQARKPVQKSQIRYAPVAREIGVVRNFDPNKLVFFAKTFRAY